MRDRSLRPPRRSWRILALSMACAAAFACAGDPVTRAGDSGAPPPSPIAGAHDWRRVIAQLRLDSAEADAPDSPARRQAIADVRTRLLESLPAGQFRSVRSYDTLPFVALEVSSAGLAALRASPLVSGISDDRLERPQGSTGGGPSGADPR